MEDSSEDSYRQLHPIGDSNPNPPSESLLPYDALLAELNSLRISYDDLQSRNLDFSRCLEEVSSERDDFRIKILEAEIVAKERSDLLSVILSSVRPVRKILKGIGDRICEEENLEGGEEARSDLEEGVEAIALEMESILKLGIAVESKFYECEEMRRKEKGELENSIISLTEENRDISSLLRIAVMEKEAVEKSLNKMKVGAEQRKGAILQMAEKGLQKVGFGFVMGVIGGESQVDQISCNDSMKSDGSECEEEVVSLASTAEKIIKNLRLEIHDLRRALEESRSDCERLQILVNVQTQKITANEQYIKDLEEREDLLSHSVEELMIEITEAEEEVARWRQACELEVEAGKHAIKERDKEVALLREELGRTKAALGTAENKLHLKEKLATTAMAAQAAAETCLRLADSRSIGLRERIEELTRQLEEEASLSGRESSGVRRRVRYVCWPWRGFRVTPTAARSASRGSHKTKKTIPEMEALLRIRI